MEAGDEKNSNFGAFFTRWSRFALLTMAAALTFGLIQAQDKLVAERQGHARGE